MWSGQALALLGHEFGVLALPLVAILTLEASPSAVALVVASANLPTVLVSLFAGAIIDRFRRRTVIVVTNVARAGLLGSIPLGALADVLTLPYLFAVAFLVGALDVGFMTAYRSYPPTIVPRRHLAQAYSLIGASDGITRAAAPSVAGGVVQLFTAPAGIGVQALCYLAAGLLTWTIQQTAPATPPRGREPIGPAFRDGVAFACRHRLVRTCAGSDATYLLFWSVLQSVLLVFLSRQLGLSPGLIGAIFTLGTLGGVAAAVVAQRIGRRLTPGTTLIVASALRSGGMVLLPLSAFLGPMALPTLITARVVNAFGWTLWEVHKETILQLSLPDHQRARVNGSVLFLEGCALTAGPAVAAGTVALTNTITTLVLGGIGTLLALAWLLLARLWRLREYPAPPDEPDEPKPQGR